MPFKHLLTEKSFNNKAEAQKWLNECFTEKENYTIHMKVTVSQAYYTLVRPWDVVMDADTVVSQMILEHYLFFLSRDVLEQHCWDALDMLVRFNGIVTVMDVLRYVNYYLPSVAKLPVLPETLTLQMRYEMAKSIPLDQEYLLSNPIHYQAYYHYLNKETPKPTPVENALTISATGGVLNALPKAYDSSPKAYDSSPKACENSPKACEHSVKPKLATSMDLIRAANEEAGIRTTVRNCDAEKPELLKEYLKTHDFHLRDYGFHIGLPEAQAMTALRKAVAAVGITKVADKLRFLLSIYFNNTKAYESLQRDLALILREAETQV